MPTGGDAARLAAFGKGAVASGPTNPAAILRPLRLSDGLQVNAAHAGDDSVNRRKLCVWCEKFSVPIGVAKMN